ncbi:hypothetical protein C0J45_18940 [Silurus meridionalis]|nr:hypothetical protein C0J45_18940 [Silurus meridionalis]
MSDNNDRREPTYTNNNGRFNNSFSLPEPLNTQGGPVSKLHMKWDAIGAGLKSVIECWTVGQKPFYESINYGPSPGEKVTDKWLQAKANLVEKMQGCGEAETLKLDAKDYHEISSAHILNAFKRIKETEEKDIPCAHFKETVTSTKPETKPDTEPETSIQRPDDPARGSPYLWSYLTSATRKEPVIGLSMITEYRNSNGQNSFLCSCCNVILATHCYMGHLINPRHRFNYIKLKNPEFLAHWKGENFGTFEVRKITELQKKAQILQDRPESSAKVQKMEPSQTIDDAGLNFVTCVHHGKKKLYFCELCSVRGHLDHMSSVTHRKKYVQIMDKLMYECVQKHKYPDWTASDTNMEKKLHKIALRLAAVERSTRIGMKKLNVTAEVFTALSTAPLNEALSQLKLLQTKPEDAAHLKTSFQPEANTFSDHEHGTHSNSMDHMICSAAITNSLQQEKSPLQKNNLAPKLHSPSSHSSQISPSPPLHSSSIFSAIPSSSIVKIMPPFFSQPESPTQCSFVPHALYEPILPPSASNCLDVSDVAPPNYFPAPPVYEPISPPPASNRKDATDSAPPDSYYAHPVYEPISPPPASNIKDVTKSVPSNSYPAPPVYEPISPPPASDRKDLNNVAPPYPSATLSSAKLTHPTECEEPADGLSNILECRRILKPTFFLCLNCTDKVSRENFCDHMTSERHKHMSIKTQYHEIFQQWQSTHQTTTHDLVEKLALAEKGLDATVIKLTQNQYESLCSADFCDDISLVRLLPESVKADKERDNQSPQNYDNTIQIKEIQVPLKGLSAVIEFRSESETSLYLCVACCRKLKPDLISCHLVKPGHRYNYLKKRYPFLFVDWSDSESRTEISTRLMRLAHKVEMTNADEPGQLQVMKLNCDDLKEIKAMSYDKDSLGPRRALKRSAVEDSVHQTSPEREQCSDVPSTQLKQSHVIGNKQKPSDLKRSKISGTGLDNVAKVQKESFILTTTKPNRSLHSTPGSVLDTSGSSPRTLHPSSQTKETTSMDQSVIKNNEKQESTSIIAPQQKDPCINTSTISALSSIKGQEIGRLCEKRPLVKKSLSENAWSYENRQFSPERTSKANINPVADNSTESVVMNQQCSIANTVHNNNEAGNPLYNSKIADHSLDTNLTHNINANVYSSMVSTYGTMASVTSQVTPSYAESNQYPICTHPNYSSANTVPSDYLGPVDETAMNYEAAPPGLDTNATYYTNLNSTHTSHTVYHSQPVYQPIQSFHIPEIYQAHYACYPYNQVLHTTQTTAGEGNATSTPAFEHGVYPLASWPQDFLTNRKLSTFLAYAHQLTEMKPEATARGKEVEIEALLSKLRNLKQETCRKLQLKCEDLEQESKK